MTNSKNNTALVFIGGAGFSPSIWKGITKNIHTPYIMADNAASRGDNSSLDSYVDSIESQIASLEKKNIIVVAHSIGGVIGLELLRRLGDRAAGFIGVSAAIPAPGKSFTSIFPFPQSMVMPVILRLAGTRPPRSAILSGLCNDLDTEMAAKIADEFSAESLHLYIDRTSRTELPSVPALYVRTTQDKEFTPELQGIMADRLPQVMVTDIASGHLPMLSQEKKLATLINKFVSEV